MNTATALLAVALCLPSVQATAIQGTVALYDIADAQLLGLDDTGWYHRARGLLVLKDSRGHVAKLCSDITTDADVKLICYRLGYSHGKQTSLEVEEIGQQYGGLPTMSKLSCTGTEQSLEYCPSDRMLWACGSKSVELHCTNSWYGPGVQCGTDLGVETVAPNNEWLGAEPAVTELEALTAASTRSLGLPRTLQTRMVQPSILQSAVQFPWTAKLNFFNSAANKWEYQCGAAIITDRIVLTLAQCVDAIGYYSVTIGDFDTKINNRFKETFQVLNHIAHPDARTDPENNDLAIVILKDKAGLGIQFRPSALPVCLPSAQVPLMKDRRVAVVAGWGQQLDAVSANVSRFLTFAEVKLFTRQECKGHEDSSSRIICAGNKRGGSDTCLQDLGAPLITKINDRSLLVGLLREPSCGVKGELSKYVSVQAHLGWLTSQVAEVTRQLRPAPAVEEDDESEEEIDWNDEDWK